MASSSITAKWANKTSLRLSINKKTHKVMYAQARKESVDFLFKIFFLPLGTIMKLLQEQRVVLCDWFGSKEFIAADSGFVKDEVAYMIKDDLEVKPWSPADTLTTLSEFGLEDYDDLEEKVVSLGTKEGMMLLKASFECKEVLTTVFLAE
ncbi:hypothetical protein OSB04_009842 [Centaurea solstitialis]|uniref:Uncharacterized protein n=1 Tax=Centaurea solstitialis TaxID=347529 RepID=A0AA38TDY0_9ASTR|nr:hypothetical protein OSB04_009842 [Centaurea solstitialis]